MPQEKAHKQGTSSLPVFEDDSYGMRSRFLLARLISPSQTSGCSSACSCSPVRANSGTAGLSNTVGSHSSNMSVFQEEKHHLANTRHYSGSTGVEVCLIVSYASIYDESLHLPFPTLWLQLQIRKQYQYLMRIQQSALQSFCSQWNKDPFYIPWETWAEWLMLC